MHCFTTVDKLLQEVRLVEKPSKINAGEVLVHAFAEFTDAHSATEALNALQVGCP